MIAWHDWGRLRPGELPRNCAARLEASSPAGPTQPTARPTLPLMRAWRNCCAVPVQPAAVELLGAVAPVLDRWGRWYLFGAQAVIAYGVPRLSADVDVTLAGSGLEDAFLDRTTRTDVGGTSVPLIDRADLIIAKILAGRPKDLEDAKALWRLYGDAIDAVRIRAILRQLEEALAQSDLLPAFQAITS